MPGLTVVEKLLLAASELSSSGETTFTAEDLVVAAWRLDPETFGLAGHLDENGRPAFPNSNRVFAEIMGSKPIRKQGLLVKAGTKTFRLTESGRQRAHELIAASGAKGEPPTAGKVAFGRDTTRALRKLLGSRAVEKLRSGREGDVTFHDASSFWGISPRSSAMQFQGRLGEVEGVLRSARTATEQRPIRFEHGGRAYSRDDIDQLLALHQTMLERFASQLDVIRRRRDER
ncbi:MAG: hypothetical protein WAQ33_12030 [Gaiellaceae bacterium]